MTLTRSRWRLVQIYLAPRNHAVVQETDPNAYRGGPFIACGQEPRQVGPVYERQGAVECKRCLRFLNGVGLPHRLELRAES